MTWRAFWTCFRFSSTRFTDRAVSVVSTAWSLADDLGHEVVRPEHLVGGLATSRYRKTLDRLATLGIDLRDSPDEIAELTRACDSTVRGRRASLGPEVESLLEHARSLARGMGHRHVGTEHLVLALLNHSGGAAAGFLRRRGADPDAIRRIIA